MKVVVDASNVAHHVKNEMGEPQLSNILAAVKALEESVERVKKYDAKYIEMIKDNTLLIVENCEITVFSTRS